MPVHTQSMHTFSRSVLHTKGSTIREIYFPFKLLAFSLLANCTESESEPLEGCRAMLR